MLLHGMGDIWQESALKNVA